ncbi:hypothetical protein BTJ68_02181 [Hortaea werneckii EXF-2000]|uniref:cysteine-S-conjugate beta-lyase n=1 Tax=Hortaea werneckii EXF-2000 TaxID=1157616 RepID=A0A1Z5TMV3_HORWE|nr:hypothetical protein BTJ68_02181 [Hortaea werneckii EXF-2000]
MAAPPNGIGKAMKHLDLDGHDLPPSPAPSSPSNGRKYALATELVYTEGNDQYNSSSVPIYQSATFKGGPGQEYDYTRSGNPTRTHLERHMAKIMNANRALVVSSGMGACDVITRILKPGDEVVTGDDLYGGTNRLLTYLKQNGGINVHHVDTTNLETVKAALTEKTAMVLLETPTNPLIKIIDIASIASAAHAANPEAVVAVDNTMMSPFLQNPLDLGADVTYESGTKYLSGHHDVMAGVIGINNAALGDKFFFMINSTGCGLAPFDSWLLLRGVKTLAVRMEKQQNNAMALAKFLENHGFKVRYPGLKSHSQYALHWSQARGAGAVLSFETGSIELSERIVEATKLFGISVSFGCVNSLISMPCRLRETGEHVTDASGQLSYIPFPTCNETGRPLELLFGVEKEINCTLDFIDDPFFHLLEYYVHNDAPLTCRIPTKPLPPSALKAEFEQGTQDDTDGQGSLSEIYTPMVVALAGTLQLSHLHIASSLNVLVHAAPKSVAPGTIAAATAYSISREPPTRIVIGDSLPLRFSVRWYPNTSLPSGWTGVGGHLTFSTLVYCLISAGASAAICLAYFRGIELPRRLKSHGKDRLGGVERGGLGGYGIANGGYGGYDYGVGKRD